MRIPKFSLVKKLEGNNNIEYDNTFLIKLKNRRVKKLFKVDDELLSTILKIKDCVIALENSRKKELESCLSYKK